MKKFTLLIIASVMSLGGFAYTWNPVGPDTTAIDLICFNAGMNNWAMVSEEGLLYLYNINTQEYQAFNLSLPVKGVAPLNEEKMLVILNGGSYSDGIWTFDFESHQCEVVEWGFRPIMLTRDETHNTYWAGFKDGGMMKSTDGLNWENVDFFDGKSPVCMAVYGDHLVVSEGLENSVEGSVFYSSDAGETWAETADAPLISDMDFDNNGLLLGIFPSYSNSSGLWESTDFGETWNVLYWNLNMSSVAFDVFGNIVVGWEEDQGVALFDPTGPQPVLTFLNEGLPNLNINAICTNPTMSAPALFVCTDQGVWFSYDYMVGIDEPQNTGREAFTLSPNPAKEYIRVQSNETMKTLTILSLSGECMLMLPVEAEDFVVKPGNIPPGVYLMKVKSENSESIRKFVIR